VAKLQEVDALVDFLSFVLSDGGFSACKSLNAEDKGLMWWLRDNELKPTAPLPFMWTD
jgi:hypothetical protein